MGKVSGKYVLGFYFRGYHWDCAQGGMGVKFFFCLFLDSGFLKNYLL